ncbi:MAG: DUF2834 domain-containing protein [Chthoniobacterales bacterium]
MKVRQYYLALAVIGLLLPYWQFVPWVLAYGLNLSLFFQALFANRIAAFFAIDVVVSVIVVLILVFGEGRRLLMRGLWVPIVGVALVGVSFGLPLFLHMRERQLERSTAHL